MKDLTDGPIARNILHMAVPIAAEMFFHLSLWLVRGEFRRRAPMPAAARA